jgi:hypothetical protein
MDLSEKVLYHQIHPAKLAADMSGSVISTYLMWQRKFGPAMLAAWVPAILGSAIVLRFADAEPHRWAAVVVNARKEVCREGRGCARTLHKAPRT